MLRTTLGSALFSICWIGLSATTASAAPYLFIDFESPTYSLGNLNGQASWIQDIGLAGAITVQNGVVANGSQAAAIDPTGSANFTRAFRVAGVASPTPLSYAFGNFYFQDIGTISQWRFVLFNNVGGPLVEVVVRPDGELVLVSSATVASGVSVTRDTWVNIGLEVDTTADVATLYYQGARLSTSVALNSTSTLLGAAIEVGNIVGSDRMYVDDLSFTSVPEPASVLLAVPVFGLLALARRRRRRPTEAR